MAKLSIFFGKVSAFPLINVTFAVTKGCASNRRAEMIPSEPDAVSTAEGIARLPREGGFIASMLMSSDIFDPKRLMHMVIHKNY